MEKDKPLTKEDIDKMLEKKGIRLALEVEVGYNRGQYYIRFPKEVSEHLGLEEGKVLLFLYDDVGKDNRSVTIEVKE